MRPLSSNEIGNIERQALALARELLGDGDQARDVVQEVLLRLCTGPRPDPARLRAWVRRVTWSLCRDLRRSQRQQGRETKGLQALGPPLVDPAQHLYHAEIRRHLEAALAGLSEKQRTALVVHELEGWSCAEIAQELGCPPGTVMRSLFHARKRMRQALRDVGEKSEDFGE